MITDEDDISINALDDESVIEILVPPVIDNLFIDKLLASSNCKTAHLTLCLS